MCSSICIYPINAAVNAVVWLSTGLQVSKDTGPCDSILASATEIRKSLGRLKDPKFINDMAAGVAKIQSQVAWNKEGQDLRAGREGYLIVNNTLK